MFRYISTFSLNALLTYRSGKPLVFLKVPSSLLRFILCSFLTLRRQLSFPRFPVPSVETHVLAYLFWLYSVG